YAIGLALYTLHYLPVVEFTPYRPGADIRAAFEGKASNSREERLVNFFLESPRTGEDLTLKLIADTGYTFILTVP
ncbi:hypothetical protein RFX70_21540, partial [Acinetobacter baumannii]|nr:hypothetical protein [Acinetobacter baumannii]